MIPIRDEIPTRHFPIVNYLLITANVLVFLFMWLSGAEQSQAFYNQYAMIPANFANGISLGDVSTIFTSMFMHAGFLHIGGNMLYLWIFGDNIEDRLGHFVYLLFYLAGGVFAAITHILLNWGSTIPTLGASGAIAAVLGAYLLLYPRARIATFIPLGFFLRLTMVPSVIVLGFWFILQLFNGVLALGAVDTSGVAVWARVGGFLAGIVMAWILILGRPAERSLPWD